ncbi:MAG: pirin family protein [Candidatus Lokiarchaeota archaeon]|nr:pirin family protein [Candidatus Lokiarchaeota archaeon]
MGNFRKIKMTLKSRSTFEGAGVRLKRAFGYADPSLDPFLLLDDFHSDDPNDYIKGFPWHPHRGIETITYMLHGNIEHGDSLGNGGVIQAGDVQWMTAGSGIIHQEMPKKNTDDTLLWGFQLWANLPASHKMMNPRYRDVKRKDIPELSLKEDNVQIKVICGEVNGIKGPVEDIITDPEYLDITINPNSEYIHSVKNGYNVLAYIIEGAGYFDEKKEELISKETLILYREGDSVKITTDTEEVRFLLISGKPLNEPVAWRGPIVMNTQEELSIAFNEYQNGTFIKHK